ncbi:MAG: anhydro-N-acetylmuramic acid kinase [Proteobacteria bacterium]|nr:anhydro-N-acetylmuramic acid kinase [Pseudomonadota bacterium]MDE3208770.1 anhydro-N-acetylmuramic acid kinase [Pseudomonadota bacterium]
MNLPPYMIGLMSGTSLDGVDAVLIRFQPKTELIYSLHTSFPPALKQELLSFNFPGDNELERSRTNGIKLSQLYAASVNRLLKETSISQSCVGAIGCHGQTIRHRPDLGYSIQIGEPALLAELTGITVVADFRSRDIAAGGQGAPLVPAFHAFLFKSPTQDRAVVNIGGISNLTFLPPNKPVSGFDCGPGNMLMDAWIHEVKGVPFDENGQFAATGRVLPELLQKLLVHPFFLLKPPKSTGREVFNIEWLKTFLSGREQPEDVQATLLELTVLSITQALDKHYPDCKELYVGGGGAKNKTLMKKLSSSSFRVQTTEALGVDTQLVEAYAFAWLARQTLENKTANLPEVTGARHDCILGAIYPA